MVCEARKVALLIDQIAVLREKFVYCNPILVPRNDIEYAFRFAREAITSQVTKQPAESSNERVAIIEACVICLEDTDVERIFSVDECRHRYCFSCMKQHVEVKLLHGMMPKCPHEACESLLNVESCRKFLTPKLIEMMCLRIKEASIPVSEKIYCPYPKCSALMSKNEVSEYSKSAVPAGLQGVGARKCSKCYGLFCINCKVPWHNNMTCYNFKRMNPNNPGEDVKLKSLATRNLWRQCVKCSHMIELAEGCYHMTCRYNTRLPSKLTCLRIVKCMFFSKEKLDELDFWICQSLMKLKNAWFLLLDESSNLDWRLLRKNYKKHPLFTLLMLFILCFFI
ncbi:hypothetical protein OIU84_011067 [Salix udensis]|uniref:RBR-type E3 ubiquitin transferase n=1 Tax=Salix udensis TaxID=889485 RepID=A0AAD6NWI6_9ROSI|nr:hypothetical protein OIU84_011067 [Salix udensis]